MVWSGLSVADRIQGILIPELFIFELCLGGRPHLLGVGTGVGGGIRARMRGYGVVRGVF